MVKFLSFLVWFMYLPNPSPMSWMWLKVNLLSRVKLVWIHRFPSPRLVVLLLLKNPVCPTIYPSQVWGEPISFSLMITITLSEPHFLVSFKRKIIFMNIEMLYIMSTKQNKSVQYFIGIPNVTWDFKNSVSLKLKMENRFFFFFFTMKANFAHFLFQ